MHLKMKLTQVSPKQIDQIPGKCASLLAPWQKTECCLPQVCYSTGYKAPVHIISESIKLFWHLSRSTGIQFTTSKQLLTTTEWRHQPRGREIKHDRRTTAAQTPWSSEAERMLIVPVKMNQIAPLILYTKEQTHVILETIYVPLLSRRLLTSKAKLKLASGHVMKSSWLAYFESS